MIHEGFPQLATYKITTELKPTRPAGSCFIPRGNSTWRQRSVPLLEGDLIVLVAPVQLSVRGSQRDVFGTYRYVLIDGFYFVPYVAIQHGYIPATSATRWVKRYKYLPVVGKNEVVLLDTQWVKEQRKYDRKLGLQSGSCFTSEQSKASKNTKSSVKRGRNSQTVEVISG